MALAAHDPRLTCVTRLRLGEMAADSGAFTSAEGYYRSARADAEGARDPWLIGWARMGLGYNRAKAARFDEAVPFFEQARKSGQETGAKPLTLWAMGNLGWCAFSLGDFDAAMKDFISAEALSEQIGLRDAQHRWLGAIGNIYAERGDLEQAASYHQRAVTLAREAGNNAWLAIAWSNLADIAMKKGDLAAAQSFNDQALAIKQHLGDLWSLAYSELNAANLEAHEHKYAQAEKDYQGVIRRSPDAHAPDVLWGAYDGLALLYQDTHRAALAEAQFRKGIQNIDSAWNQLGSDDWRMTFLVPQYLIGLFRDYVEFLIENHHDELALEMVESSRARVLSKRLELVGALPANFRMERLLAVARASHTVILSYWLAPGQSSLWVIGLGRTVHYALPAAGQIEELVRKYAGTVTAGRDPLARRDSLASDLYQAILAPAAGRIPPDSNVIVVPDGVLHELNFETLVVPLPKPHYWIEDVTIATAPSLRILGGSGDRVSSGQPHAATLLLFGDPVLNNQEFGTLPNVKREIAAVQDHFQAANRCVFTGARAVPEEYAKASPANFTNIHFATHATANRESPLNSAIILSHHGENFKLYARDVAAVPLRADLVTISACTSAGAKAYAGEGLMGFAWAFLQAGARNVIASLWDVDDASSVDIMRDLYAGLAAGQTPARALRTAKLTMLRSGNRNPLWSRPYYWGPLQVFTRGIAR